MAEFRSTIDIAATPDAVFEHLVTGAGLTTWLGRSAALDPVPGGTFAVEIAGSAVRGRFEVVDRPHRVVVTWGFAGSEDLPPGASRVSFRLTAVGARTRVDLCHSDLPDDTVAGHEDGWSHFLPRLQRAGAGIDPGPSAWVPDGH